MAINFFSKEVSGREIAQREEQKRNDKIRLEQIKQRAFAEGRAALKGGEKAFGSTAAFSGVGSIGQSFNPEQEALREVMGHGEKVWGIENDPVKINHDLNPRRRGDYGTGAMFGF